MSLLLGIDLGTTGCKAAIYDACGALLGESYFEYGLITLSPSMIEQDPELWWDLTCQAVAGALSAPGVDRSAVRGIAVSSQGISFVPVDASGRPLAPAISWLDTRAGAECSHILERYAEAQIAAMTGKRVSACYVLPKLLWLRAHEPDLWRRTHRILMGHDYLVYRLSGEQVTDHSMAGGTLLYDLQTSSWSQDLCEAFGIPQEILPSLRQAGTPVGTLRPTVAQALGLRPDVVVAVGGQDQKCAALGAGIRDGVATLSLGTASAITQVMDSPRVDALLRVPTFAFVVPGRWVLEGVIGTAAVSLRWFRDTVAPGASYEVLDREAALAPRGAGGVLFFPHLEGASSPWWRGAARGTFHGLSLAATRGHLTRAILEGVAFQMRANLAVTQELAGPVRAAIVFGGGARSVLWRSIIGDVIGRPLAWTRTVETANLGACMLAGIGCGLYATLAEARQAMVGTLERRHPDAEAAAIYAELYEQYRQTEERLLP